MRISLRHPEREKDTLLPHRKYPADGSSSSRVFFRRELETFSPVLYDALGGERLKIFRQEAKISLPPPSKKRDGQGGFFWGGGGEGYLRGGSVGLVVRALPHEKWADEAEEVPIIKARRRGEMRRIRYVP